MYTFARKSVLHAAGWVLLCLGMVGGLPTAAGQYSAPLLHSSSSVEREEEAHRPGKAGADRSASLFYVAGESTTLYNRTDSTAPVARLSVRTAVRRLGCEGEWCRVRTDQGRRGFVPAAALSNVWIRVSKKRRHVYLYRGLELIETFEADLSYNSFSDKSRGGSSQKRDHWRTPEGNFHVVRKNPNSQFYKALVLNYPTVEDARRGLEKGLISQSEYEAIERAQREFRIPPMDTELGGWIEIHGDGTGDATTWTQGCVAVRNQDMNLLWTAVRKGTPVLVE